MTLCRWIQSALKVCLYNPEIRTHHFQCPYPPDPYLELALHAWHVFEVDALPPAAPGGLAPEQQQLLRHADRVDGIGGVVWDICPQPGEGYAADDGFVGLAHTVTPSIGMIEPPDISA